VTWQIFVRAAAESDLEVAICGWVAWFNEERLHGELDDATPAEIEAATTATIPASERREC
jgi:transposase InsO family protein